MAVLPLAGEESQSDFLQGGDVLAPILMAELIKTKKFEVVSVGLDDLRIQTGRLSWTGAEVLPADFFDSLQSLYGCDAVLFCQLTVFHAYPPLAVGWRMKLVDARTRQILWAVDKVYDAESWTMLHRARRFHIAGWWVVQDPSNDWQVKNSPRNSASLPPPRPCPRCRIAKKLLKFRCQPPMCQAGGNPIKIAALEKKTMEIEFNARRVSQGESSQAVARRDIP